MSRAAITLSTLSLCLAIFGEGALAKSRVLLPPAQYDRPAVNVTVIELPASQVHDKCVALGAPAYIRVPGDSTIEGCSVALDRLIVVPTPDSVGWSKYACIWRHEVAHINGWAHDHPGGRHSREC